MAGWNGFTDQDLQKLKDETTNKKLTGQRKPRPSKTDQKTTKVKTVQRVIPPKIQLHPEEIKTNEVQTSETKTTTNNTSPQVETVNKFENNQDNKTNVMKTVDQSPNDVAKDDNIRVLTDVEALEVKMSALEKLQSQQKVMEEENKKRKTMIKETLAERMRLTQHESKKLLEINKQLSRLDQVLQVDVEILRNKIDDACVQFSHAQKRFQTAEQEYVTAKLDFYKKKEDKDQLQECLYTIIQENEIRKSKKLEELLEKLNNDSDSLPSSPTKTPTTVEPLAVEVSLETKQESVEVDDQKLEE